MKYLLPIILFLTVAANGMDLPQIKVPRLAKEPLVDGTVNPDEWRDAAEIPAFIGAADRPDTAIRPTRVRLGWTPDWLFIAFECTDPDIVNGGTVHDAELHLGDVAEIFIDPVGDNMEYFEIAVAPNGTVADLKFILTAPPVYGPDGSFAGAFTRKHRLRFREWSMPKLKAAAAPLRQNAGFQVEVAIPAEVLMRRLDKKQLEPMTMRANFCRFDYSALGGTGVFSSWSQVLFGLPHSMPRRFGFLTLTEKTSDRPK